jgi:hypothetical protein
LQHSTKFTDQKGTELFSDPLLAKQHWTAGVQLDKNSHGEQERREQDKAQKRHSGVKCTLHQEISKWSGINEPRLKMSGDPLARAASRNFSAMLCIRVVRSKCRFVLKRMVHMQETARHPLISTPGIDEGDDQPHPTVHECRESARSNEPE